MPDGPAVRGRRNPALIRTQPSSNGAEMDAALDEHAAEPGVDEREPYPGETGDSLVYPGEEISMGISVPVLFEGDSKETIFTSRMSGIVQPGETAETVYARVAGVVNENVINQIDDFSDRMSAYAEERAARRAQVTG